MQLNLRYLNLRFIARTLRRAVHRLWLTYGVFWIGAVMVGLVAVAYARLADAAFTLFRTVEARFEYAPLLITPLVGVLCVWLTRRYFAGSEGSGIPQVIATVQSGEPARRDRLLSLRVVFGKIAVSTLGLFGGFTIGREGPSVHVGASLLYNMRFAYERSSTRIDRQFIVAGGAAGLAAAFNTPLAGVVFAFEELNKSFEQRTSGTLITGILLAGIVALAIEGNYTHFGKIQVADAFPPSFAIAVGVIAVFTGLMGALFSWMMLNASRWMPGPVRRLRDEHPLRFALVCAMLVAIIGFLSGGITWGSGYHEAQALLSDNEEVNLMFAPLKVITLMMTYLMGMPGGIFAPTLAIGAGFGQLANLVFPDLTISALIALAMVGYLAAVTQAPITSFVIMMEMIDGHSMVISLMATALVASSVARAFNKPFYETLSQRYLEPGIRHRVF
ncbi:MAG: chloride channel protein [Burkholderiaceae bacterium]|nr:chloride channel protein [Burkholderiaceae bacterium]